LGKVNVFATKLELIAQGRMVEAARVQLSKQDEEKEGIGLSDDDFDMIAEDISDELVGETGHGRRSRWTSTQISAARDVISRFMEEMPKSKCENCLASVPVIKHSGVGKIFQVGWGAGFLCRS
jgi:hypothetical protein